MFATDEILPPDPEGLDVLHDREYRVRAFRLADDHILIRGAVAAEHCLGALEKVLLQAGSQPVDIGDGRG